MRRFRFLRASSLRLFVAFAAGLGAASRAGAHDAADSTATDPRLRIDTYKSNYFTYNTKDVTDEVQDGRLKLRISIQSALVEWPRLSLHLSYSMLAFWEIYEDSSPLKEYVHNPEVFFRTGPGISGGLENLQFGWEHESNGQPAGPTNRSWDRLYLERVIVFEAVRLDPFDSIELHPRVWWMFDDAPENHTMRDVENFSGGNWGGSITTVAILGTMGRFAFELGLANWVVELHVNTLPGSNNYSTFIQLFQGRGEGLVGFDEHTTTLGVGIALIQCGWNDLPRRPGSGS